MWFGIGVWKLFIGVEFLLKNPPEILQQVEEHLIALEVDDEGNFVE